MSNSVIIMAGGLGKRMNSDLPKVLHKLGNIPMLVRVIREANKIQPDKIFIVVGKYKDVILDTLTKYISLDNIEFVTQELPLGTGHAIICCREKLENRKGNVVILSGDVPLVSSQTIKNVLKDLYSVNMVVTNMDNPHGYGRIIESGNNFVKIVEEKDCLEEERKVKKINCGMYAFNTQLLIKYLSYLNNKNSQNEYYLTDMIKIIQDHEETKVGIFEVKKENQKEIQGVNTQEQLRELEQYITPYSWEDTGRDNQWKL